MTVILNFSPLRLLCITISHVLHHVRTDPQFVPASWSYEQTQNLPILSRPPQYTVIPYTEVQAKPQLAKPIGPPSIKRGNLQCKQCTCCTLSRYGSNGPQENKGNCCKCASCDNRTGDNYSSKSIQPLYPPGPPGFSTFAKSSSPPLRSLARQPENLKDSSPTSALRLPQFPSFSVNVPDYTSTPSSPSLSTYTPSFQWRPSHSFDYNGIPLIHNLPLQPEESDLELPNAVTFSSVSDYPATSLPFYNFLSSNENPSYPEKSLKTVSPEVRNNSPLLKPFLSVPHINPQHHFQYNQPLRCNNRKCTTASDSPFTQCIPSFRQKLFTNILSTQSNACNQNNQLPIMSSSSIPSCCISPNTIVNNCCFINTMKTNGALQADCEGSSRNLINHKCNFLDSNRNSMTKFNDTLQLARIPCNHTFQNGPNILGNNIQSSSVISGFSSSESGKFGCIQHKPQNQFKFHEPFSTNMEFYNSAGQSALSQAPYPPTQRTRCCSAVIRPSSITIACGCKDIKNLGDNTCSYALLNNDLTSCSAKKLPFEKAKYTKKVLNTDSARDLPTNIENIPVFPKLISCNEALVLGIISETDIDFCEQLPRLSAMSETTSESSSKSRKSNTVKSFAHHHPFSYKQIPEPNFFVSPRSPSYATSTDEYYNSIKNENNIPRLHRFPKTDSTISDIVYVSSTSSASDKKSETLREGIVSMPYSNPHNSKHQYNLGRTEDARLSHADNNLGMTTTSAPTSFETVFSDKILAYQENLSKRFPLNGICLASALIALFFL